MTLPNQVNPLFLGPSASYTVGRSLRFRSSASAYLNRTPSSSANSGKFTVSFWTKLGSLNTQLTFLSAYNGTVSNTTDDAIFLSSNQLTIASKGGVIGAPGWYRTCTQVLRDPSAWYHIVIAFDMSQSTNATKVVVYINGVQVTAYTDAGTFAAFNYLNTTNSQRIGQDNSGGGPYYSDMYMAEMYLVDGQQLTASSFGAYDNNGIWQPKKYTGTYGTNGFYLPFSNTTSTTTLVQDASGNGNNWTANNISLTAGTTYDSMIDSPTVSASSSNYCVLNPLKSAGSNGVNSGNLNFGTTADGAGNSGDNSGAFGSIAVDSGKWYFEATKLNTTTNCNPPGFASTNCIIGTDDPGLISSGKDYFGFSWASGGTVRLFIRQGGVSTNIATGLTQAQNDVFALAIDLTNNTIAGYKNGVQQGSTTSFTATTNLIAPCLFQTTTFNYAGFAFNFGQRPFSYTPPTGYSALNTYNLPTPTISYGAPYMNAITYTGYGPLVPSGLGILTKRNASTQNVSKSLRFRASASAYLNRTFGTPTNNKIWTYSFWTKRGLISNSTRLSVLGSNNTGNNSANFEFASETGTSWTNGDNFGFGEWTTNWQTRVTTLPVFRDPSAWYHIVIAYDSTQATASNRVKIYVNGSLQTVNSSSVYPTQNVASTMNVNAVSYAIGSAGTTTQPYDGYIAEAVFVDGQQLTPSSFGQTNSDGIWVPKAYAGTYGTNGFYLPFTNTTSTTTLGNDSSGNGNNFTVNNISLTAGTTYDSMIDSPTDYASAGNYCTMNPLDSLSGTASNGNLLWTAGAAQSDIRGTITIPSSGKFYMECTVGSTTNATSAVSFGLATSTVALNSSNAVSGLYQLYASSSGYLSLNGTNVSSSLGVWTAGDILQIAVDVDNTKMWLGKNNTWYDSSGGSTGNPSTGANATSTASMVGLFPFSNCYSNNATWNMGQRSFVYAAPTGFTTLNTYNITAPSTTWFSSANNSGVGSATAYPDFVWIKSRSSAQNHSLNDTLRGPTLNLITNNVNVEAGASTMFNVNKYGLTLGNDASVNSSSYTDVMWGWQAGQGTTSTNTSGTITSQVSANASSGFSILTYTGNFTAGATVGHGLGVAPSMILVKTRTQSSVDWITYHVSMGPTKGLYMDTGAATTSAIFWNNTSPTSSVITLGAGAQSNGNAQNMVAYCWAAVKGYSAFGSYTGNGSADGPFVFTNFRPRYVLLKNVSTSATNWIIFDTSRNTYNVSNLTLDPASSNAELTSNGWDIDILSNGFKIRNTSTSGNGSGNNIIYAAFCENPFNYSRAR